MAAARGLKFVLSLSLYCLLSLGPLSQLHFGLSEDAWISIYAALVLGLMPLFSIRLALLAFGFSCCVLPVFGVGTLSLFVSFWLFCVEVRIFLKPPTGSESTYANKDLAGIGCFFFLLAYSASAIHTVFRTFDGHLISGVVTSGGVRGLYALVTSLHYAWFESAQNLCGWILCCFVIFAVAACERYLREQVLLGVVGGVVGGVGGANEHSHVQELRHSQELRYGARYLLQGLALGACVALGFLFIQIDDVRPWSRLHANSYFLSLKRYSGTFSDPNAFGVMSLYLIPLLFAYSGKFRWLYWCVATALAIGVQFSGSRTFWLGGALWLLYGMYQLVATRRRGKFLVLISLIVYPAVFVMLGEPRLNEFLQHKAPYQSVIRTLNTLHWERMQQMLGARALYTGVALEVARTSPIIGVGVNRFVDEQAAAAYRLGTELGAWRDNANNFYLHVLAEQGILGFTITILALYLLFKAISGPHIFEQVREVPRIVLRSFWTARVSLSMMLLLLLSGPHIFFEEVRYLLVALYGYALACVRPQVFPFLELVKRGAYIVAFIFPGLYTLAALTDGQQGETFGLYPPETINDEAVVWTGSHASFKVCYDNSGEIVLRLRALHPDIAEKPVNLVILVSPDRNSPPLNQKNLSLTTPDWTEIRIPIPNTDSFEIESNGFPPRHLQVELSIDRLWSPRHLHMSSDPRWLGVMMSWVGEECG